MATDDDRRKALKALAEAAMANAAKRQQESASGRALVEPKKVDALKTRYNVLQDMFAAAQYHAEHTGEAVTVYKGAEPHIIDKDTDAAELVEIMLADQLKAEGGSVWAAAKGRFAKPPVFKSLEQAQAKLVSELRNVEMLWADHAGITGIDIGAEHYDLNDGGRRKLQQHFKGVEVQSGAEIPPAPAPDGGADTLDGIDADELDMLNRAIIKHSIDNIGAKLSRNLKVVETLYKGIANAVKMGNDTSLRQLMYLTALFADHLDKVRLVKIAEDPNYDDTTQYVELLHLQRLMREVSELESVAAVVENNKTPLNQGGSLVPKWRVLSSKLQKSAMVSEQKAGEKDAMQEAIFAATKGWLGDPEIMGELHAHAIYEALSENKDIAQFFPYTPPLSDADRDVRLVIMNLYKVQSRAQKDMMPAVMEGDGDKAQQVRGDVYQQNKDPLLAAYLESNYHGPDIAPTKPDNDILEDKVQLRNWLISNAQLYLNSGSYSDMPSIAMVDLWQRYQNAKVITPDVPMTRRAHSLLSSDTAEVLAPTVDGETQEIGLMDRANFTSNRDAVMAPHGGGSDGIHLHHPHVRRNELGDAMPHVTELTIKRGEGAFDVGDDTGHSR